MLALRLFAAAPNASKGIWVRSRQGPARDAFLRLFEGIPGGHRRVHPGTGDDVLYGAVDLAATLEAGSLRTSAGILGAPGVLVLTMAERCTADLAGKLAAALDRPGYGLIALDEGDEGLPAGLEDRLGLFADLEGIALADLPSAKAECEMSPGSLKRVSALGTAAVSDLVRVATQLGIESLRAPLLASGVAAAHAALNGRCKVSNEDLVAAVEMVLAHRATQALQDAEDEESPVHTSPEDALDASKDDDTGGSLPQLPQELLLEAAKASLPNDILDRLAASRAARVVKTGSGAGMSRKGNRKGRPLPPRPGSISGGARVDLVATLRAAVPWQRMRGALSPRGHSLSIRAQDFRIKRYEVKSDRVLVFAVDASGSAALARLAEAKGAVELLLAQAYARRDHVALVAFRGQNAEILLPPTRSLVQTKRRLAGLPGGGGTPLAAGLAAARDLAVLEQGRGMSPSVVLLTDGRANIAMDGGADRARARQDAEAIARQIAARGINSLVVDTGARPHGDLEALAQCMAATYLPLPRADSERLSASVSAALTA